jgi:hypothetical protein
VIRAYAITARRSGIPLTVVSPLNYISCVVVSLLVMTLVDEVFYDSTELGELVPDPIGL